VSGYLYPFNKGDTKFQIWSWSTYWGRFIDEAHSLAQEHHIDHWYWWDRIKENKSENTENKSSSNSEDNGTDKNKKNRDSDKNNSPSNTDSKGERGRGGQGEVK